MQVVQSETLHPHFAKFIAALSFPVAVALLLINNGTAAWRLKLDDPDNYGRLAQVRDLLGGQPWWDTIQHRVNPPAGLDTHWSRVADLPIAAMIELVDLVTTQSAAEQVAVTILPLIYLSIAMLLIGLIAHRLAGNLAGVIAMWMLSVSTFTLTQFVPGRIDHHGLQILLTLGVVLSLCGKSNVRNGAVAAALTATSLAVGLETLPYLALAGSWVALRWVIRGADVKESTLGYSIGIAVAAPAALIATRNPAAWLLAHHDAMSIAHVAIILAAGASLAFFVARDRQEAPKRRLIAVLFSGVLAALPAAYFLSSFAAPYSQVDPRLQELWIGNIVETQSFIEAWQAGPIEAVGELLFLILSMSAGLLLLKSAPGRGRDHLALAVILVSTGLALTCWQIRGAPLAYAFAIPVAASAIVAFWSRWRRQGGSILPLAALVYALNPVLPPAIASGIQTALNEQSAESGNTDEDASCDEPSLYRGLAMLEPGLVVSPIDISTRVLARTPHSLLSSSIHRNGVANAKAYQVFLSSPEGARELVSKIGARYIVYCPTAGETKNLVSYAPRGLLAQLATNRVPVWLSDEFPGSRGLKIYSVRVTD